MDEEQGSAVNPSNGKKRRHRCDLRCQALLPQPQSGEMSTCARLVQVAAQALVFGGRAHPILLAVCTEHMEAFSLRFLEGCWLAQAGCLQGPPLRSQAVQTLLYGEP